MGYVTRFNLYAQFMINNTPYTFEDDIPLAILVAELRKQFSEAAYALGTDGSTANSSKWYEHQRQMQAFSLNHPGVLFTLHGEGEENSDVWNEYYLNGKVQVEKATMQIGAFDPPAKLK